MSLILKDQLLTVVTKDSPSSPCYSSPSSEGLVDRLFGNVLCCSSTTNQVKSELAQETKQRQRVFSSTPIHINSKGDTKLKRKGSCSPYDSILKKEMTFRAQPGVLIDGFDDLRVTHPISPVASACKSYDSSDTLTTAMSSTRHDEDDELSCNTILNSYDDDATCYDNDDELSLFSRTACLPHDEYIYDDDWHGTIQIRT